ncbi:hypothetical protein A7982_12204 [Minicystis rosea]|nr:hypothetical protein A7982_12204 [Minicystis rosea]
MIDRSLRHRGFARRLLEVMGVSSIAAASFAACGGKVVVETDNGGGGGGFTTSSTVTTSSNGGAGGAVECDPGTGQPVSTICVFGQGACAPVGAAGLDQVLADEAGVCNAVADFFQCCELKGLSQIFCGPDPKPNGGCCYGVLIEDTVLCGVGRPFVVAGIARTAPSHARADWSAAQAPMIDDLDPATRAALAASWTREARFEHASVASFARLALELLAVGAPADLVRDAQRAMGDEIRHAELCFALASRYAGEAVGPGPIAMDGALGCTSLAELAAATVREGCIGETVAALVAEEARDVARDPAVRAALDVIAADEAEHAAMAWRLVAWAHREGDAEVRAAIAAAFATAVEAPNDTLPEGIDSARFRAHGRPLPADVRAVAASALSEVIRPSAAALLGSLAG